MFSLSVSGQKQINSPYARFNLGTLEQAASFKSLGMGGIGVAMRSGSSIFFANPASYSSIDTNSFIFDIGIDYGIVSLSDKTRHFQSDDMNFDHLLMAFPIAKGFGIATGIVPYSSGYYKLSQSVVKTDPDYDPIVGQFTSSHNGDGGYNNLFLGAGLKLTKNFSVGVNMKLLFGQVNRTYLVTFDDYANVYNNSSSEKLDIHGLNFDYGLQYTASLKNDYFLLAGVSYSATKNYKTSYDLLSYRYTAYNTRDTLTYIADDSTRTKIPGTLGIGLTIGKIDKFTAGVEYTYTKWSDARIPGAAMYAADTRAYRFGIEYTPDKFSNYSIFKRLEYRAGAHYGDSYLVINNNQVREYGFSFGVGVPMRRTYSRTNFFFDYTRRSDTGTSLAHIEDYYTMGISLNLFDRWFLKRRYD
jgi:hypothetical protein